MLLFPFLSGTDDVLWSPSVSHVISRSDDDEDFSVLCSCFRRNKKRWKQMRHSSCQENAIWLTWHAREKLLSSLVESFSSVCSMSVTLCFLIHVTFDRTEIYSFLVFFFDLNNNTSITEENYWWGGETTWWPLNFV